MKDWTDRHIEDSYAQNVVGSPAFVEDFARQEEDDRRLDKLLAEATIDGEVTIGIDLLREASEQGLSRRETAMFIYGADGANEYAKVCRACKKYKVELAKEKTGAKTTTKERATILLKRGDMSAKEIGIELGVSPQRISQIKRSLAPSQKGLKK